MPVMRTVVCEVSVNVPEPRPLKGVDLEANAVGKVLRTIIRLRILRAKNFIVLTRTRNFLYKDSCPRSTRRSQSNSADTDSKYAIKRL